MTFSDLATMSQGVVGHHHHHPMTTDIEAIRTERAEPREHFTRSQSGQLYEKPPEGHLEWLFILVICSTQFFVQGALGYILIPLHVIGETFQESPFDPSLSWHVAGYMLTAGTFILLAGKLGDVYGSKKILLIGWIWFGLWGIIGGCTAWTHSVIFFDVARAIQGLGPALLLPNALAIAGRTYPRGHKKNVVFSLFAMAAPLGCVTAGIIGSAFAQYVWWPWSMWTYGIGCFVIAITGFFVIPRDLIGIKGEKRLKFDYLGSALGVSGLLLLNISWNQAPIVGWGTPYVYVFLILGFICFGFFVFEEKKATNPLLDLSFFNIHVALVLTITGLGWSSFGVWFYYMFQFIQNFRHVSPLDSAIQFLPGAISGILAAIFTPYLIERVPREWPLAIASSAFLVGSTLQAMAPVHQHYWFQTFWSFVVMAWGMDISFPAATTILSNSVPVKHQGLSSSLANTVVNYSIAIGLGIAGTVEAGVNKNAVTDTEILLGYRAALFTSVGLSGVGFVISAIYAIVMVFKGEKGRRI